MGHRKKLRVLISFFKDKTSILKANLSTKRHTKLIHVAVLKATTHDASSPPSDDSIATILSFGHGSPHVACTCIDLLMDRLHRTKNASVALKCLYIFHIIIKKGSLVLKDQLSVYPSFGGRNFLNFSRFRDEIDITMWDLSSWVRWHAAIVEGNLSVSRFVGNHFLFQDLNSLSTTTANYDNKVKEERVLALSSSDLLGEIDVLINFVQVISEAPESLHLQRKNLIHEIVMLVSQDYRSSQREIFIRVVEFADRISNLSFSQLTQFLGNLERFESCEEKLVLLFVNRNRNDSLRELVNETKRKIMEMMKEKGKIKLLKLSSDNDSSELTQFGERSDKLDRSWAWTRFY